MGPIHGVRKAAWGAVQRIPDGEEAGLQCPGVRSPRSRLTALDLGFSSPSRHPSFIYAQAHK